MKKMEENRRLLPKQEKAILALLEQPTIREAAQACKVGETTLYAWLNDADFVAEYRAARQRVFEAMLSSLQGASNEAVRALLAITKDEQAPSGSRVAAARSILEFSLRARTELEVEQRLQALEQQLSRMEGQPNVKTTSWTH